MEFDTITNGLFGICESWDVCWQVWPKAVKLTIWLAYVIK